MNWMELANKEAIKAYKNNEVPVGAVLVCNNKVVSKAYNKREKNNNVLGHAEVLCIQKATKKMKTWKLNNCDIYVTLKPCHMCNEIIKESRIRNVYYLTDKLDNKNNFNQTNVCKINSESKLEEEYVQNLSNFFEKLRKK